MRLFAWILVFVIVAGYPSMLEGFHLRWQRLTSSVLHKRGSICMSRGFGTAKKGPFPAELQEKENYYGLQHPCYCGSGKIFGECCGILHAQPLNITNSALQPDQIVGARYTAYNTEDSEFLIATSHSSEESYRVYLKNDKLAETTGLKRWRKELEEHHAEQIHFLGLDIVRVDDPEDQVLINQSMRIVLKEGDQAHVVRFRVYYVPISEVEKIGDRRTLEVDDIVGIEELSSIVYCEDVEHVFYRCRKNLCGQGVQPESAKAGSRRWLFCGGETAPIPKTLISSLLPRLQDTFARGKMKNIRRRAVTM